MITLIEFLLRTMPLSSIAKPACIKNTNAAQIATQSMSMLDCRFSATNSMFEGSILKDSQKFIGEKTIKLRYMGAATKKIRIC